MALLIENVRIVRIYFSAKDENGATTFSTTTLVTTTFGKTQIY